MNQPRTNNAVVIIDQLKSKNWADHLKPNTISPEQWVATCQTALNHEPDLYRCEARSVINALTLAAEDGLRPNKREAALVIYNDRDRGPIAQYLPMIGGIQLKVQQSLELNGLVARVVYENDPVIEVHYGDDEKIVHIPALTNRGEPIGAYAIARFADGRTPDHEWMTVEDIDAARNKSRAKKGGPWFDFWGEMARKVVARRLSKRLPLNDDLARVFSRDDAFYDLGDDGRPMRDVTPKSEPPPARPTRQRTNQAELPVPDGSRDPDEPHRSDPAPEEPADDPWTVQIPGGEDREVAGPGDFTTQVLDVLGNMESDGDIDDFVGQNSAAIDRLYEVNEAAYGKIQHTIREARSLAGGGAG